MLSIRAFGRRDYAFSTVLLKVLKEKCKQEQQKEDNIIQNVHYRNPIIGYMVGHHD